MTKFVEIKGLTKTYFDGAGGSLEILKGIDLDIAQGSSISIKGESGCGKSTLLQILGGLDHPTKGEVNFEGKNLFKLSKDALSFYRNTHLGFVFQAHHLLEDFNALENVMLPALISGKTAEIAQKLASELLTRVGLSERLGHKPGKLSGGERQRVAIARALINQPKLLLCDEPTGSLDEATGNKIGELLWEVTASANTSLVIVTHNSELAAKAQFTYELAKGVLREK
ncbi:MAG: ABC transporter ATP-binding protein [SAR324 cluster bacterium]|nr:ABC transporter ATP-binding protein [SAR324 cluster bacterium]